MEKILIGKFVNTRGLRGELTVLSYSGNMKTFMGYEKYFVKTPRGFEELVVTQKTHYKGDRFIFRVRGVENLEQAEAFRNTEIYIDSSALPGLEDGEFFYETLEGAKVFIEDRPIGTVKQVLNFGSCDILEVQGEDEKKTVNLPVINDYLKEFSPKEKRVVYYDIDGLL